MLPVVITIRSYHRWFLLFFPNPSERRLGWLHVGRDHHGPRGQGAPKADVLPLFFGGTWEKPCTGGTGADGWNVVELGGLGQRVKVKTDIVRAK